MGSSAPPDGLSDEALLAGLTFGDAEAGLNAHQRTCLSQQLGAEGMDCPALDARRRVAEPRLESVRYLAGGLVGERERADPLQRAGDYAADDPR